ncbi:MAG: endonuclease/exonuclease/phosphatase family protein [Halanaerobiaceae bacterium]
MKFFNNNIKFIILIFIFIIILITIYHTGNKTIIVNKINNIEPPNKNISLMTYNIHRGIDAHGNSNLKEISELINNNQVKIVGLNEVDKYTKRSNFQDQIKIIAEKTGMNYVYGPNLYNSYGRYGNGLLSKYPIIKADNHRLPRLENNEPRGLIDASILLPDNQEYHILVTHLSINKKERYIQLNWIEKYVNQLDKPYILMGDLNEEINEDNRLMSLSVSNDIKTFPSESPEKQIDHIFTNIELNIIDKKSLFSTASDHLPLFVEFIKS